MTKAIDKKNDKIIEDDRVILNTEHFSAQIVQNDQGIVLDVFHRHGDLIDSFTFWNDNTDDENKKNE